MSTATQKAATFFQVIFPIGLLVIALIVFLGMMLVPFFASPQKPAKSCIAHCHPHVSKLIENQCHCAVDDGWLKHVEDVTEITHGDPG